MKKNKAKIKTTPRLSREERLEVELISVKLANLRRDMSLLQGRLNAILAVHGVTPGETVVVQDNGEIRRAGPQSVVPTADAAPRIPKPQENVGRVTE